MLNPLEFDLDPYVTRIAGHNAAGKSVIVKSLKLFSGVYTGSEISALVSKKRSENEESIVQLVLENGNLLTAVIGRTQQVNYYYTTGENEFIKTWNGFDTEITELLNWNFIENTDICLNFKHKGNNIFIDTKPQENTSIMNYLCNDVDVELRISNIEEYIERLRKTKFNIDDEKKRLSLRYEKFIRSNLDKISDTKELAYTTRLIYMLINVKELVEKHMELKEKANQIEELLQELKTIKFLSVYNSKIELDYKSYDINQLLKIVQAQKIMKNSLSVSKKSMTNMQVISMLYKMNKISVFHNLELSKNKALLTQKKSLERDEIKSNIFHFNRLNAINLSITAQAKIDSISKKRCDDFSIIQFRVFEAIRNLYVRTEKMKKLRSLYEHSTLEIDSINRYNDFKKTSYGIKNLIKMQEEVNEKVDKMQEYATILSEIKVCPTCGRYLIDE